MDLIKSLKGNRIYLDTNIWIYAFEGYFDYSSILEDLFNKFDNRELIPVTSDLTIAEALVKPFMDGNIKLQNFYTEIFKNNNSIEVIPISKDILIKAAYLSASFKIKLPDAIHAATSILNECHTFLTNDKNLVNLPELNPIILSDLS